LVAALLQPGLSCANDRQRADPQDIPVWELSPPVSLIGGDGNTPDYQLYRVAGAFRLSSGAIVIVNAGTRELRFYDSAGVHTRTAGGRGSGPGEFNVLAWAARIAADTILAWDSALRRASLFSPAGDHVGEFAASHALPAEMRSVRAVGVQPFPGAFGDGSMVMRPDLPIAILTEGPNGMHVDTLPLLRRGRGGSFVLLGEFPDYPRLVHDSRVMLASIAGPLRCAIGNDRVACVAGVSYEIEVRDMEGRVVQTLRSPREPQPLTPEWADVYRNGLVSRAGAAARAITETMVQTMKLPAHIPAFDTLMYGADRRLWARRYALDPDLPRCWEVFDSSRSFHGFVRTPAEFHVLDAGADYVLGIVRDSLDVAQVRLHRLVQPGQSADRGRNQRAAGRSHAAAGCVDSFVR
jgi:hypothetical protein